MITTEERFEQMQPAFDKAARDVLLQVQQEGFAVCELEPGDSTCYRFVFIPPMGWSCWREDDTDVVRERKYWMVVLSLGGAYEWGFQRMHYDYCAQKWGDNGREWTGRVVCALLNAIVDRHHEESNHG